MNRLPPELDIPVLTDVIDEDETHHVSAAAAQVAADDADTLQHLEDAIVNRLMVQLSNRIPLLLETALREFTDRSGGCTRDRHAGGNAQCHERHRLDAGL